MSYSVDCKKPLGLENGDIKDSQLSADSSLSFMKAKDGRLNNKQAAWCGFRRDSYFQVVKGSLSH